MDPTHRPHTTTGVALLSAGLLSAGLICVTPTAAPRMIQPTVELAAAEAVSDLAGLGETSAGAAEGDSLMLLDPDFWQLFWYELSNPDAGSAAWLLLVEALEQLPIIGPVMMGFGLLIFPATLLLAQLWYQTAQFFGFEPYPSPAEESGTGLQGVYDAVFAGGTDPALAAGVSTALADVTSVLDLNPSADIDAAIDPTGMADIGMALDLTEIPVLDDILTSLIP